MLNLDVDKPLADFTLRARLNLGVGAGVTALFGPSGSGKTTLVNMIAGLARPRRGVIELGGRVLFDGKRGVNLPPERRRMGYVFQEGRLFPHLTVRRNLLYGHRLLRPAQRRLDLERVVELTGIGHLLDRRPATLSGGEKQRVAVGRALLTSPELLLMDEPLASLDQSRKDEILPFLADLPGRLGIPILYVSHDRAEISGLADVVVMLHLGEVEAVGRPADLGFAPRPASPGPTKTPQQDGPDRRLRVLRS